MRISTFVLIIACLLAFSLSIAHADLMEGLVVYFNFDQGETDIDVHQFFWTLNRKS